MWSCWIKAIPILLVISVSAFAESQPPTPTPLVGDKPPQSNSEKKQHKATQSQRGTEKTPLFLKGEITTQKSETDAASDAKQHEDKSASDNALVRGTEELAFQTERLAGFTLILAAIAFFQFWMFVWQLILMRGSMKTAEDATKAAMRSADLAEKGLRLTQRPQFGIGGWNVQNLTAGGQPEIYFKLSNSGRSEAELIGCRFGWHIGPKEPVPSKLSDIKLAGIIYPNAAMDMCVPLREITEAEFQSLWASQSFIFLYGEMTCTDTFDWTCIISMGAKITVRKGVATAEFVQRPGVNQIRWYEPKKQEATEAKPN